VFPETATNLRKKDVEIKETKAHAVIHGVAENLKAGLVMTAEKFGEKFDNWFEEYGGIKPFETFRKEIKLRHNKRSSPKLK